MKDWLLKSVLRKMLLQQTELSTVWEVHDLVGIKFYLCKNCWIFPNEIHFLKQKIAGKDLTNPFSYISHHLPWKDWKITFHSKRIFSPLWIRFHSHHLLSLFGPAPTYVKGLYVGKTEVVYAPFRMRHTRWGIVNEIIFGRSKSP